MIFRCGFVHCDPHPGNFILRRDGKLAILDWGQTHSFAPPFRRHLCRLVVHMAGEHHEAIAAEVVRGAIRDAAVLSCGGDAEAVAAALFSGDGEEPSAAAPPAAPAKPKATKSFLSVSRPGAKIKGASLPQGPGQDGGASPRTKAPEEWA